MPTTSAPIARRKRYSARVSRFGPATATYTPSRRAIPCSGGDRARERPQRRVVRRGHVGKARAEPIVVRPDERIVAEQVDVVGDQHQVAGRPVRIHSAAGVRHDRASSRRARAARAPETSPAGANSPRSDESGPASPRRLAAQRAAQQPAGVRLDGRQRKAGNVARSRSPHCAVDLRASPPSPVPRMIADVRPLVEARADRRGGALRPPRTREPDSASSRAGEARRCARGGHSLTSDPIHAGRAVGAVARRRPAPAWIARPPSTSDS